MTPQKIEKWLPVRHFFHVPSKHVLYVKTMVYKKVSTLARFYTLFICHDLRLKPQGFGTFSGW